MDKASSEVDVTRFQELSDGDPASFRELVELYLTKTTEQLADLEKAINTRASAHVSRMAHSLVGANLMVGLTGIVPALRQLETQGEKGDLSQAPAVFKDITGQFHKIREVLQAAIGQAPS